MALGYGINAIFTGLSSDTKPTNPPAFSIFYETDTRRIYLYDGGWQSVQFGDITRVGALRLDDSDDSNYVELVAPSTVSSNKTWTLPATDVTKGTIQSDGSGVLSMKTPNMYPINLDNTSGTGVSENTTEQISKSYVLPANDYDMILVFADIEQEIENGGSSTSASIRLFIGATAKSYSLQSSNEVDTDNMRFNGMMMLSAVQQSSATIKVSIDADASPEPYDLTCKGLYVFGLRYA